VTSWEQDGHAPFDWVIPRVTSGDERDFVKATADENAGLLEVTGRVQTSALYAIASRDVDELIASLSETLDMLEALVDDLTASRAEGAAVYANDPEFRRVVDELARGD
jgi:hypothetical protein